MRYCSILRAYLQRQSIVRGFVGPVAKKREWQAASAKYRGEGIGVPNQTRPKSPEKRAKPNVKRS